MENISALLPDRSHASLAPYLPIEYATLKLVGGSLVNIVLCLIFLTVDHLWLHLQDWPQTVSLFLIAGFVLSALTMILKDDVNGNWWTAYLDRNWHGYTLWIYRPVRLDELGRSGGVDDEVRHHILRDGQNPTDLLLEHPVAYYRFLSIPLRGWPHVPSVRLKSNQRFDLGFTKVGISGHSPFRIGLVDREFCDAWQVIVKDSRGDRLTVPVETALDIVSVHTPGWDLDMPYRFLSQVLLGALEQHKLEKSQRKLNDGRFRDARIALEEAITMIRASTRFQRSKEGKATREFLELHLRMLNTGESEEEARKNMSDDVT